MRSMRIIQGQDGQMAIFVALIFQVLFVFFAMVINIGLLVHDKINLQNSVDLGAYYAAERQAELLNMIAHQNYQIRQSYKLLAWRYRVVGTYGLDGHPLTTFTEPLAEEPYVARNIPSVCIAHNAWKETVEAGGSNENICHRNDLAIPEIPPVQVIPLALSPFNAVVKSLVEGIRGNYSNRCSDAGPVNFALAATWLYAFREDQSVRRRMIEAIARDLSGRTNDFYDLTNASVLSGVMNTVKKNLTVANRDSVAEIKMLNGLALEACQSPQVWLPPVLIAPTLLYTNFTQPGCNAQLKAISDPVLPSGIDKFDPTTTLRTIAAGELPPNETYHSSLGYEKNPWCMAYIAVRAKTAPRKPFAPFGKPIQLEAVAYAQPFGGRIGPWFSASWPQGAPRSVGQRLDPLVPPRVVPGNDTTGGAAGMFPTERLPNYSRFPGDTLGLGSKMALGAARSAFPQGPGKMTLGYYSHYLGTQIERFHGDVLAWDSLTNTYPPVRDVEAAMIAPDLFDITYYSIEPRYFQNYLGRAIDQNIFKNVNPISDIGWRRPEYANGNQGLRIFSVDDQMSKLTSPSAGYPLNQLFYFARSPQHLLTGWTQKSSLDYSFPSNRFGVCMQTPGATVPNPGNCVGGGRTGYSVRLVSPDYLRYQQHPFGGAEGTSGAILNPPPADF